jgi:hypothetical protein
MEVRTTANMKEDRPMITYTVHNAFYAPALTVIDFTKEEAEQAALLVTGGVCTRFWDGDIQRLMVL